MAGSLKNYPPIAGTKAVRTIELCRKDLYAHEMEVSWCVLPIQIVVSVHAPYPAFGSHGNVAEQLSGGSRTLHRLVSVNPLTDDVESALASSLAGIVREVKAEHAARKKALSRVRTAKGVQTGVSS